MTPTLEQRIAFANGLAHLLLKHAKLTRKDKAYVESVRDAKTPEALEACWRASALASASAYASASASPSALASASASASAWDSDLASDYDYPCRDATKAGVPKEQVDALRALTLGVEP